MTEKPIKEFETITTQEEFDERIKARLARERERWQKESGTEELQQQLRAKDEEISQIRHEHFLEDARRDVRAELARRGVTDEGRIERALKFIDFSEASDTSFALNQVDSLARDFPELVPPRGAGSGGSSRPVLQPQQKPLTREEVEGMSESEINSRWDQVKAFMQGQRS
jgi:hypothetical protein